MFWNASLVLLELRGKSKAVHQLEHPTSFKVDRIKVQSLAKCLLRKKKSALYPQTKKTAQGVPFIGEWAMTCPQQASFDHECSFQASKNSSHQTDKKSRQIPSCHDYWNITWITCDLHLAIARSNPYFKSCAIARAAPPPAFWPPPPPP